VDLPPDLSDLIQRLQAAHPEGLTLDELAEALEHTPLTYADVEVVVEALEDAGVLLEGAAPNASPEQLVQVLAAARALAGESGESPSIQQIAERAGLSAAVVRRALRLGRGPVG
jgi:hypothetical protein